MTALDTYINNFLFTSQFTNNLDDMGNIILNVSASAANEIFIAVNLNDNNYNNQTIGNLYDVSITTVNVDNNNENLISMEDLKNSYNYVVTENETLRTKLDELISQIDSNSSQAEIVALKNLILTLRIQLGEGKAESDFGLEFPYQAL